MSARKFITLWIIGGLIFWGLIFLLTQIQDPYYYPPPG